MNITKLKTVAVDILEYLENYEKSPFDNNTELSAYIRQQLEMPLPSKPVTAKDLLKEFVKHFEQAQVFTPVKLLEKTHALLHGTPSPDTVTAILSANENPAGTQRTISTACLYSNGWSIDAIAQDRNVTRERIRQILAKFVRENTPKR